MCFFVNGWDVMDFIWNKMIWFGILRKFILINERLMIFIYVIGRIVVDSDVVLMYGISW